MLRAGTGYNLEKPARGDGWQGRIARENQRILCIRWDMLQMMMMMIQTHIHIHTHAHIYIYIVVCVIYIYIYIYIYIPLIIVVNIMLPFYVSTANIHLNRFDLIKFNPCCFFSFSFKSPSVFFYFTILIFGDNFSKGTICVIASTLLLIRTIIKIIYIYIYIYHSHDMAMYEMYIECS